LQLDLYADLVLKFEGREVVDLNASARKACVARRAEGAKQVKLRYFGPTQSCRPVNPAAKIGIE
jgi:hypothetical protein